MKSSEALEATLRGIEFRYSDLLPGEPFTHGLFACRLSEHFRFYVNCELVTGFGRGGRIQSSEQPYFNIVDTSNLKPSFTREPIDMDLFLEIASAIRSKALGRAA